MSYFSKYFKVCSSLEFLELIRSCFLACSYIVHVYLGFQTQILLALLFLLIITPQFLIITIILRQNYRRYQLIRKSEGSQPFTNTVLQ